MSENATTYPGEYDEKEPELQILDLLHQFIKKTYECSVAFHGNLNVRLVKAKLDVNHTKLQLIESKKATPLALDGGIDHVVVQTVSPQTKYDQAVANYKQMQRLITQEAKCLKKQKKGEFKAITSSFSLWATLVTWFGLTQKQKNLRQFKKMSLHEQHATLIEQFEVSKLSWFARKVYKYNFKRKSQYRDSTISGLGHLYHLFPLCWDVYRMWLLHIPFYHVCQ